MIDGAISCHDSPVSPVVHRVWREHTCSSTDQSKRRQNTRPHPIPKRGRPRAACASKRRTIRTCVNRARGPKVHRFQGRGSAARLTSHRTSPPCSSTTTGQPVGAGGGNVPRRATCAAVRVAVVLALTYGRRVRVRVSRRHAPVPRSPVGVVPCHFGRPPMGQGEAYVRGRACTLRE
jgi:hypothetical protein